MKVFARIKNDIVHEIIEKSDDFKIVEAYHSDLISADLGGTSVAGDGFVIVPAEMTVKEGYLYDRVTDTFNAPLPLPPLEKPVNILSELVDVLITKNVVVMTDFSADAQTEITERKTDRR